MMRVISRLLLLPSWLLAPLLFLFACGVTQEDACAYPWAIQENPEKCATDLKCYEDTPKTPICDEDTHKCVPCRVSSACVKLTKALKAEGRKGTFEVCETEGSNERFGQCVGCTADSQCESSKLCRTADPFFEELLPTGVGPAIGECFPEEAFLYVHKAPSCSMLGTEPRGSPTNPYCDLSEAYSAGPNTGYNYMILAVKAIAPPPPAPPPPAPPPTYPPLQVTSGSVIIVSWPLMQVKPATNPVRLSELVVGQAGSTAVALAIGVSILAPSNMQAITCQHSGKVGLRDVVVSSRETANANVLANVGVITQAGCSNLRIERTHIDFFAHAGLWIQGGNFAVVNSAITRCGQGTLSPSDPRLTGIYLDQGTAGNGTIDFSTIAKNPRSLYCATTGNKALLENQVHYSIFSSKPYEFEGCWTKISGNNAADPMIFSQIIPEASIDHLRLDRSNVIHTGCCIDKGPDKDITDRTTATDYFGLDRVRGPLADYGCIEL